MAKKKKVEFKDADAVKEELKKDPQVEIKKGRVIFK